MRLRRSLIAGLLMIGLAVLAVSAAAETTSFDAAMKAAASTFARCVI